MTLNIPYNTARTGNINVLASGTNLSSPISNIQFVSITIPTGATSATATITSVDTARTTTIWNGQSVSSNVVADKYSARIELTNATTVTAYRNTSDGTATVTVNACIVEWASGVITSIQRGTITLTAAGSNTATISAVTLDQSTLLWLGQTSTFNSSQHFQTTASALEFVSTTSIRARINDTSVTGTLTVGYEVVQWSSTYVNKTYNFNRAMTGTSTTAVVEVINSPILEDGVVAFLSGMTVNDAASSWAAQTCRLVTAGNGAAALVREVAGTENVRGYFGLVFFKPQFISKKMMLPEIGIAAAASTGSDVGTGADFLPPKTILSGLLNTTDYASAAQIASFLNRVSFSAPKTVTATRGGTSDNTKASAMLVEFI